MNRKSTFSHTDIALLAAFCMFLSLIEYMIPKPMPFMRLGLAHLPILLSLLIFPPRRVLLLTLLKVLGQGLINGTLFSYIFLFSAAGSFSSTIMMLFVYNLFKNRISLVGVSTAGAMASNIVQVLLAREFIFGKAAILIAPPFLAAGIASSILLGLFAAEFAARSEWLKQRGGPSSTSHRENQNARFPRYAFICGILAIPAFLFQQNTAVIVAEAVVFVIISIIIGNKFRLLPNIILAAGIITANLLAPFGMVIAQIGNFDITAGALKTGAAKAAVIIGLIYLSRSSVRSGLALPGKLGNILSLVFFYFEKLAAGNKIERKNIILQLDTRLVELGRLNPAEEQTPETGAKSYKAFDYVLAGLIPVSAWGAFIVTALPGLAAG